VLFNKKAESINPYDTTTGNLTTTNVTSTGVLEPYASNLKINVLDSYASFNLRNLSARTLFIDIYECVPTMKFNSFNPLTDMRITALDIQDADASDRIVQTFEIDGENTSTENFSFICAPDLDAPALLKANGWKWKYVKRSMMLASQESCTHSIQGPKGLLDMQKLWDPATATYKANCGMKDWSKHVIISCRADPANLTGALTTNQGLRYTPSYDGKTTLFGTIAVEVSETIKLSVPEVAGFVSTAVTAGKGQPLNLRKKRYQFTNLTPGLATLASGNVLIGNEFNPTATSSDASHL